MYTAVNSNGDMKLLTNYFIDIRQVSFDEKIKHEVHLHYSGTCIGCHNLCHYSRVSLERDCYMYMNWLEKQYLVTLIVC